MTESMSTTLEKSTSDRTHGSDSTPPQMQPKYRPLGKNVLVLRDAVEEKTPGGILLPDVAQKKLNRGRILAIGDDIPYAKATRDGVEVEVPIVNAGSTVLYKQWAGTEIPGSDSLLIMSLEDLLVVVE